VADTVLTKAWVATVDRAVAAETEIIQLDLHLHLVKVMPVAWVVHRQIKVAVAVAVQVPLELSLVVVSNHKHLVVSAVTDHHLQ
jgi:hypothetical protein